MVSAVRNITLRPGEVLVISAVPPGLPPLTVDENDRHEDVCPQCEENEGVFHGPPTRASSPPPSFSQAVGTSDVATTTAVVSSSWVVATDPDGATNNAGPSQEIGIPSTAQIGNSFSPRAVIYLAFKRVPHPNEIELAWPLENYDKVYAVFRGSRIGMFPTWEIAQVFVLRVSGASYRKFSRFSDALKEYRRLFFRTTLVPELEVRPDAANPLFDFEDRHFDGDLKVIIPPDNRPFPIPINEPLPSHLTYADLNYRLSDGVVLPSLRDADTLSDGVITASLPGAGPQRSGNAVVIISDGESDVSDNGESD
ncbi:hypothetical protein VKT23_018460 [Stygiomarasmius scandens]|uniref:Ribonuclease H1 N-terminal domain-containing protein n=1 Tax=Marasmiellus scandens TaxID=2682957 RepID=A0ABR1INW0_9AGAR